MTEVAPEQHCETERDTLKKELVEELRALQSLLPKAMDTEPNRFEGSSRKPIHRIKDNDARLLLKALKTIRAEMATAGYLSKPIDEALLAGLAISASVNFPVEDDLGTVTDSTRAKANKILKL